MMSSWLVSTEATGVTVAMTQRRRKKARHLIGHGIQSQGALRLCVPCSCRAAVVCMSRCRVQLILRSFAHTDFQQLGMRCRWASIRKPFSIRYPSDSQELPSFVKTLSDAELRAALTKAGFQAGPVLPSTRPIYEKMYLKHLHQALATEEATTAAAAPKADVKVESKIETVIKAAPAAPKTETTAPKTTFVPGTFRDSG
jgi:hypothetical protein